jgi:hypothetical protein
MTDLLLFLEKNVCGKLPVMAIFFLFFSLGDIFLKSMVFWQIQQQNKAKILLFK